jgi:hypothetical protein
MIQMASQKPQYHKEIHRICSQQSTIRQKMHLLDHFGGVFEGDLDKWLLFVGGENLSLSKAGLKNFTPRSGFIFRLLRKQTRVGHLQKMTQRRNKRRFEVTKWERRDRQTVTLSNIVP